MVYSLALFAHIVGVLGIFTMVALELTSLVGLRIANRMEAVRAWASLQRVIAVGFPLAGLLTLAAGLFMALSAWGWTVPWIDVGFGALVTMTVLGRLVNRSRHQQFNRAIRDMRTGPVPVVLVPFLNDTILWFSTVTMTAIGLGVVFVMTTKPGVIGSLAVIAVALCLGMTAAFVSAPPRQTPDRPTDDSKSDIRDARPVGDEALSVTSSRNEK